MSDSVNNNSGLIDFDKYIEDANKTNSRPGTDLIARLHGVIGISTEAGELLDNYKKQIYYGKEPDAINVEEELGDLMWYIAIAVKTHGLNMNNILAKNIAKLKVRYPDKYTSEAALNRNLDAERKQLEENPGG